MSKHYIIPPRLGGGCRTSEVKQWLLSNLGPYSCMVDPSVLYFITSYADTRGAAALALYLRQFESAGVAESGTITLVRGLGSLFHVRGAESRRRPGCGVPSISCTFTCTALSLTFPLMLPVATLPDASGRRSARRGTGLTCPSRSPSFRPTSGIRWVEARSGGPPCH